MKQTDMWDVPTGWDSAVSLHILHSITTLYTFYKTFRERKYLPDDFTKLVNYHSYCTVSTENMYSLLLPDKPLLR